MATHEDVRRIASALPGAIESEDRLGFSVMVKGKPRGFLWEWAERVHPKRPRVLNPNVLAIVVRDLDIKEILLASETPYLFTEPHYNGFAAVLVHIADAPVDQLEDLIVEAWRCKAPPDLLRAFDSGR